MLGLLLTTMLAVPEGYTLGKSRDGCTVHLGPKGASGIGKVYVECVWSDLTVAKLDAILGDVGNHDVIFPSIAESDVLTTNGGVHRVRQRQGPVQAPHPRVQPRPPGEGHLRDHRARRGRRRRRLNWRLPCGALEVDTMQRCFLDSFGEKSLLGRGRAAERVGCRATGGLELRRRAPASDLWVIKGTGLG